MSLEDSINELTAAVKANTAALKGGSTTSAAATKGTAANKPPAAKKSKHTVEQACALLQKIKDEHSAADAKAVIADCGFTKMAEITLEAADSVFEAATAKLEELSAGDDEGDI